MKNLWLVIIALAGLAGMTLAGGEAVDLSGTWVLDPAHSQVAHTSEGMPKIKMSAGGAYPTVSDEGARSTPPKEPPEEQIEDLTLVIVQTAGEVQITREFTSYGEDRSVTQKFALDGNQCMNLASDGRGEFVSRTTWKKGKLINSGTQTITMPGQPAEISVMEEYSISKNGEKLTIKTMNVTPKLVTTLKQVFNRRG